MPIRVATLCFLRMHSVAHDDVISGRTQRLNHHSLLSYRQTLAGKAPLARITQLQGDDILTCLGPRMLFSSVFFPKPWENSSPNPQAPLPHHLNFADPGNDLPKTLISKVQPALLSIHFTQGILFLLSPKLGRPFSSGELDSGFHFPSYP